MEPESTFRFLKNLGACRGILDFVKGKTLEEAWATCKRADWMFRLCEKMEGEKGWPTESDILIARYAATVDIILAFTDDDKEDKAFKALLAMLEYAYNPTKKNIFAWHDARNIIWDIIIKGAYEKDSKEEYYILRAVAQLTSDAAVWSAGLFRFDDWKELNEYMSDICREYLWIGEIENFESKNEQARSS